ncbi:hypothetical protein [Noviherbaspirillum saxi]|uniref:Phenylacetate-coenzyme A ligase PaaK, adenylate-forming domain family n=1 Tax=Noviherbaspirillum saxi TaxID=2320863 RepID=A0A3A3FN28_9BURK|nr:hypothetical protein [Noviherbaspirillum saxi]RJF92755.1 hypothetical protein D3871_24565 [Noviherbaspirillum saxi]
MSLAEMSIEKKAELLLNNPIALADYNYRTWQHLPRAELDAVKLEALKQRFAALRNRIPVLKKLADGEGIEQIEKFDDVVPLLFEHTVFKSYPPSLLEKKNFTQINKWIGKLVTPEYAEAIAAADVSSCKGLDDWFDTMDQAVPQVRICHTSGTSGTLSFLPNSVREWEKACDVRKLFVWKMEGPNTPQPDLHTVYPYYRKGYLSHVRANDFMIQALLPDESNFHAAYPATLSSDVLHLGAKLRAAHAKGTLDRLDISPEMIEKKKAFDKLQAEMPKHLAGFFEEMATKLKGKRVYIGATWNLLHNMAKAGLERGLEGVFHPDSYITTTGGAKGVVQPEGWREDVMRFTGVKTLNETYAMSELVSGSNPRCEHGHFHFTPTVIPFLLDPETSKPLPREGRVTGRAAFYDLGADIHWGGFITGDEITVEWDKPCACGRPSAYVAGPIQRYSEKNGGDDKITCAATEGSHREAMDFLNNIEG